jgi:hypothetical protein
VRRMDWLDAKRAGQLEVLNFSSAANERQVSLLSFRFSPVEPERLPTSSITFKLNW